MTKPEVSGYKKTDSLLKTFLKTKDYEVISAIGSEKRGTFTYVCESDGMKFVVKLGVISNGDDNGGSKRIRELKNEVFAVGNLWKQFPKGETKTFLLPPGAEVVFDEEFEKLKLYGYTRFYIDGRCLGSELRDGSENVQSWVGRFVDMVGEIDSLLDLDLPRTKEKANVDFSKLIIDNTKLWGKGIQDLMKSREIKMLEKGFDRCACDTVKKVTKYFSKNHIVVGTTHGELIPDHIIVDANRDKPYLVNFTKLCQYYPRFFDTGKMYGWILAVLGDIKSAEEFWDMSTKKLNLNECKPLKMLTNELILGSLYNYLNLEGEDIKFGCSSFF